MFAFITDLHIDFLIIWLKLAYANCTWISLTTVCTLIKNIDRHTAHSIVSWPNPKQWQMDHTSDLMMILRSSTGISTIIIWGMGKLNTHSPIYCISDNRENWPKFRHTLEVCIVMIIRWCNVQITVYDYQAIMYSIICAHKKTAL